MCIGAMQAIDHLVAGVEQFVQPIVWTVGLAIAVRHARGASRARLYWTDLVIAGVLLATIAQVWIDRRVPFAGDLLVFVALLVAIGAFVERALWARRDFSDHGR